MFKVPSKNIIKNSVLVIGSGWMAEQYLQALSHFKMKDVTILGNTKEKTKKLSKKYGFESIFGGFEKKISLIKEKDLVIISTPVHLLHSATKMCLETGQKNILVEKPGALYSHELSYLAKKFPKTNVRVGYNRLLYPNFLKLKELIDKDDGITSCYFTFTELIHLMNFKNNVKNTYSRWGISSSLHVLSMVIDLIGFPKKISTYQYGELEWHKAGSIFVGSGISRKGIPFSYHADWSSVGRWGIEIMTKKHAYRLIPLEHLFYRSNKSFNWKKAPFKQSFSTLKPGIGEELILMLCKKREKNSRLITLNHAAKLNNFAEKIFGY